MEAESYNNAEVAAQIQDHFIAAQANIKVKPAYFHRFEVLWTPSVLILDADGTERFRLEGYLPREEFSAQLELGRARLAWLQQRWEAAQAIYEGVARQSPRTVAASAAIYWGEVCYYKRTQDHTRLRPMAERLRQQYPTSLAAEKAIAFLP
ncbi:MAG: thioredoxin fold domain-containing protein [Terriglobales bacterium]